MSDYIEREAAFDSVFHQFCASSDETESALNAAIDEIKAIPAADVRPVVLCRDCEYWNDWDSAGRESLGNYVCSCARWTVEDGVVFYTRPTDFCSRGAKMEES